MPFEPDKQPMSFVPDEVAAPTQERVPTLEPPKGFIKAFAERPEEKLPFIGPLYTILNEADVIASAQRLQRDNYSPFGYAEPDASGYGQEIISAERVKTYDIKRVEDYLKEKGSEYTLGGQVGRITSEMPAFVTEFLATGGLAKIGNKAARKAGIKLLGKYATTTVGKTAIGAAAFGTSTAFRASGMPTRAGEAILKRQTPQDINIKEDGTVEIIESAEKPITSIWKGLADHYIEVSSEQAGEFIAPSINKIFTKLPFMGKLTAKLQSRWLGLNKGKTTADFLKKIGTKTGFHGVLSEIGEEYLGDTTRAIVNVDDFGAGPDANILERVAAGVRTDTENLPAMLIAFSIPGAGAQALAATQTKGGVSQQQVSGTQTEPSIAGGTQTEQQVNVYKTVSDSRTGIPEQDVVREGERYVDKVTGEDVVLDTEASGTAIEQPVQEEGEVGQVEGPKTYKGKAYRTPTDTKIKGTAADIIRYEQEELGNTDLNVSEEKLKELEKRPASDIIWVTREKVEAAKYAQQELGEEITVGDLAAVEEINVEGGEIIADIGPDGVLVLKPEQQPKPPRMGRKKALKLGHDIPDILGWDEAQRRDFMQQTVGKPSMKNMTPKEMKILVTALQVKMREAGLEYTPKELPVKELVETLEQTKKPTEVSQIEELNRGRVRKAIHSIKSAGYSFITGLERLERFCESLDGHKGGVFTNEVWKPIKQKDELSTENANNRHKEFLDFTNEQKIDSGKWLSKKETIEGVKAKLTPFQKIGVYLQSQNEKGMKQLVDGVGLTPNEVTTINDSLTPEEQKVADWLSNKYEEQWPILQQAAAQAGMDLTKLKKEFRYAPIIRLDSDLETQEDFLSAISDAFKSESATLEKEGIIQKRKPGAYGKIELDAAVQYLHNANRVERFIQFAPEAKRLSSIFNNRKFKEALNTRTYGQGVKLFNKWVKDSIRGSINDNTTFISKSVSMMRRNGIVYAIAYNVPSSLRQTLSLSNAVAVDPLMMIYTPVNLMKASNPFSYKKLEQFVYDRSLTVKHASFDRDLSIKMNRYALEMKLKGKQPWSRRAVRWIRWMDRHTRVVAWKSLYDVGMKKFDDEAKAVEYADKWIGRTQPMADMKDLPHFFRGGTLETLLSTFQNQINNNGNFYVYDIVGAKMSGEIGYTKAGYRVMFSYILPALMFGMIGRTRRPKTIGEVITDLVTYPIASVMVVGRWVNAMIQGWSSGTIAEAGPAELSKLVSAVKRKELMKIIKYAVSTIGAFTGRIPAQAIRTTEGAGDLYKGETKDWRRLIYSEQALKEKKKKSEYTGGYVL